MTAPAKKIGPLLATFVVANNMIGSGFFLLPATLAQSGAVTVLSWLMTMVLALVLGGAFARLARDYPSLETPDDYVRPALGRDASFLATTLYWVSSWIGNNAIAVAAFGYLIMLLPFDGSNPAVQVAGQVVLIWMMFAINLLGPRPVARFQSFCVVFGLLPVAVVLIFGWGSFDSAMYHAAWNTTGEAWNAPDGGVPAPRSDMALVFTSLAPIFWAFVGLETGAMVAGIVRDPARDVPRATLAGILIAGTVYLVSSVLVMGIVPASTLAGSSAPFALVAGEIFGPWAIPVIAAAAALKATGTLGGWMQVSGESGARAAQRGFLPAVFGRFNRRGAAAWGLGIVAAAMSGIALLTLSPTVADQFGLIVEIVVMMVVLAYAAAGLSLLLGTAQRRPNGQDRLFGIGALLACVLLLASYPLSMLGGGVVVVAVVWGAFRLFGPKA
ncbi:amino acid permease [Chiayiivirga flava]|uniref:Arginine:agmatine antiporter n=1 Tax=Chiayiivirga flava TaxID=659595 RepID=A0A7W8D2C1_9GAMM|nr:amino acid permease [Chiayiivirga flava]MBB5206599.1 arginine:agmatine antiporter [Chiayiivirga flava]